MSSTTRHKSRRRQSRVESKKATSNQQKSTTSTLQGSGQTTPSAVALAVTPKAPTQVNTPKKGASNRGKVYRRRRGMSAGVKAAIAVGVGVVILAGIFYFAQGGNGGAGKYPFTVGKPGPGEMAPPIKLASTTGGALDLTSLRGKTVLLYFQEGVSCQPCWDQLKDIQAQRSQFTALGIDEIVTVTSDPLDALQQKVANEGITTPVLSDRDLAVSSAYSANQYGMMGTSADGHTFIVVGPDARIRWRADYGGAPKYTMYVPVPDLLTDLRAGLQSASSTATP